MQFTDVIQHAYAWKRDLFKDVVADFIRRFTPDKEYLNPQMRTLVNA